MKTPDSSLEEQLLAVLRKKKMTLASAESCTGGLVSALLTAVPGSSDIYFGGAVSYTNKVKQSLLGVSAGVLDTYGAVSEPCAKEMAEGAARVAGTDAAFSVTGIAGPGGGTALTPVGTVCFGFYIRGKVTTETCTFSGGRNDVRSSAAAHIFNRLLEFIDKEPGTTD